MSKQMIRLKIDVKKIDKALLFVGAKGTYLDATVMLHDGPDSYGNDGFIVQDVGKERRLAGEKGAILGNVKMVGGYLPEPKKTGSAAAIPAQTDDDGKSGGSGQCAVAASSANRRTCGV